MEGKSKTTAPDQTEVTILKTLVLKPQEKSVRRVRLQSGRTRRLVVPGCVTQVHYGLPKPELFVIRSLGSESSGYIAVNPVSLRPVRHKFDPLGVREFTWVRDLKADPVINKMVFSNRITGQSLGECELTAEESKDLEKWSEVLGGQFELTIEAGFNMTIRRPGQPDQLFSLVPNPLQVASFDLEKVLLTNLSNMGQLGFISRVYYVFYKAWKQERFDSLALLSMLGPPSGQNEILDSGLQSISEQLIRSKVETLVVFRDYVLHPLDSMGFLQSNPNFIQVILPKVTKTLEEWNRVLKPGQTLLASQVRTLLMVELPNCIPLATSWWRQLESSLSPTQSRKFSDWMRQEAESRPNVNTINKRILPIWKLWGNATDAHQVLHELQDLASKIRIRSPNSKQTTKTINGIHFKDSGHIDQISLMRFSSRTKLRLCCEFPIAAIDGPPELLFRAGKPYRDFTTPNEFYTRTVSNYSYNCLVPFSGKKILAMGGLQYRDQYIWYTIALKGYLLIESVQYPLKTSANSKFDIVHGFLDLKPESLTEPNFEIQITQKTASRTHLYFLRTQGLQRAILRMPIRPNNPSCQVHMLESAVLDSCFANRIRPYRQLEGLHSIDPRFSHVFAYFESVRQLLLAEMQLECPADLYPNAPSNTNIICRTWRQEIQDLDQWRLRVTLTAVNSHPDCPMSTQAFTSWDFALSEHLNMLGNNHLADRLYGQEDIYFQFRWRQLPCWRIFGLWMREHRSYTVFVLRKHKFTVAVQRPPHRVSLDKIDSLMPTSMRDNDLPIMFARCESWRPGQDYTFAVRQLRLVV